MAVNKKIVECTELTTAVQADALAIVDVSDTTDDPTGTSKFITRTNLIKAGVATITDADHTATAEQDIIFFDLSGGVGKTLTFEAAANRTRPRLVKNLASSTANLTIEGDGSETIDGAANVELAPGDKAWFIPRTSSAWESI